MRIDIIIKLLGIVLNNYRILVIIVFGLIGFLLIIRKRKIKNKFLIEGLSYAFIVFFVLLIGILTFFDYKSEQDYIRNMPFVLETNTCNFEYTGEYKYLDLYSGEFKTPTQKPDINQYVKSVNISGDIEEVKICILANIRGDHKGTGDYSFEVYTYLGSQNNKGYINVGRYNPTKKFFDGDSGGRNQELYGRFNGNETPFKQVIDLERVIVADVGGTEFYRYIRPIVNFQKQGTISVGAYVEGDSHRYAGKVLQFRIIWKGTGTISK